MVLDKFNWNILCSQVCPRSKKNTAVKKIRTYGITKVIDSLHGKDHLKHQHYWLPLYQLKEAFYTKVDNSEVMAFSMLYNF